MQPGSKKFSDEWHHGKNHQRGHNRYTKENGYFGFKYMHWEKQVQKPVCCQDQWINCEYGYQNLLPVNRFLCLHLTRPGYRFLGAVFFIKISHIFKVVYTILCSNFFSLSFFLILQLVSIHYYQVLRLAHP